MGGEGVLQELGGIRGSVLSCNCCGQSSESLSARVLIPGALSFLTPWLRPPSPPTSAESPRGRQPDVIFKETEAMINYLSLGLQGRSRGNDNVGRAVTVPRVPTSPSQPLADSSITPHPRLIETLLQPRGEVGTCSLSHGVTCQAPGCWPCVAATCLTP